MAQDTGFTDVDACRMHRFIGLVLALGLLILIQPARALAANRGDSMAQGFDQTIEANAQQLVQQGQQIFRFDTFGDEDFWGGQLHLHEAIAGAENGGMGPGVSPATALSVGLKVDFGALPHGLRKLVKRGQVDLNDPATTLALLKLDAVVGVTGHFDQSGQITSVGIQCALCHSTVDDSFAPGIGRRLDGWPNRDLDVGAVIGLAPDLSPVANLLGLDEATVRAVLASWGPGRFDAQLLLADRAVTPSGGTGAVLIPPAFGLAGVNLHTSGAWGSVPYWNAFVANLEMHGKGTFVDARLNNAAQFPVAAAAGFANVRNEPDLITSKLPALHFYQLAIPAPRPPAGSFDPSAAARGSQLFSGKAQCASCHVPPLYTEPGWNTHTAAEIGIDDFQASRDPDHRYRTTPLAGLWAHQKGGFYHDGRFATLPDVIQHYTSTFALQLTDSEVSDLTEFLKSLPND
jgi:hypothetical protein